jgi:glycosyltransferase A (GT-A) superfamily protein (DUF2064 family)
VDRLAAVVPALDEAESIAGVAGGLFEAGACCVFVVDGGSTDGTPEQAASAGAHVIHESRRGYGRACLTGAAAAQAFHPHGLVAFLDGDGSCDPGELSLLAAHARNADVVLGVRSSSAIDGHAYPWHARTGNRIAAGMIGLRTGKTLRDLSPFKVLRADALARLQLRQQGYAWTTELVARANLDRTMSVVEVPVSFRARRGGASKVSGRLLPSIKAGMQMLRASITETSPRSRLVLMAKGPQRAKTRLAATAGAASAAGFWAASLADTASHLMQAAEGLGLEARVMLSAADEVSEVSTLIGPAWITDVQAKQGLSEALVEVFDGAFLGRAPNAIAVSGDNPTLPPSLIHEAARALRRSDAVLGPTKDGGYYLVGFRRTAFRPRTQARLLHDIFDRHVGGEAAREATHQAMLEAGLTVAVLEHWSDVDTLQDLRELAIALARSPEAAPATSAWLASGSGRLMPRAAQQPHIIRFATGGNDADG